MLEVTKRFLEAMKRFLVEKARQVDRLTRWWDFAWNRTDPDGWWQKNVPIAPRQSSGSRAGRWGGSNSLAFAAKPPMR